MQVPDLVLNLNHPRREVRYSAGKALILLSATQPAAVYPYLPELAARLTGKDKILRWNATRILANLCAVDDGHQFDPLLPRFLEPLRGPDLVAAANVLQSLAPIARARPELAPQLAQSAIQVRSARFRAPECRLVVIGHALNSLTGLLPWLTDTAPVSAFAQSQRRARRPQVRKAAVSLLRQLDSRAPRHATAWTGPAALNLVPAATIEGEWLPSL